MARPQEVEAKLLAIARPVADLWRELEALRELDGHVLAPLADRHISDRYFDTVNGALRHADLALRVREADDGCTMAIKGKSSTTGNVVTRLEFERPCGPDGLGAMLMLLREHGVALPASVATAFAPHLGEVLARAGLVAWQARTTRRQRRVVRSGGDSIVIAELALDECRYRIGAGRLSHYEVEVESVSGDAETIARLLTALHRRFGERVQPWPHSKLATGAALTALATEGGREAVADEDNVVRPEVYADVECWLAEARLP